MKNRRVLLVLGVALFGHCPVAAASDKPRVIVTSDGEIDDQCSMVRFLLYANEWDVEGIITSSSQYHWQGHKWAGDHWIRPFLQAYASVHANLMEHDSGYPTPEFLQARTLLGNVKAEGEMAEATPGSERIVSVLLDDSDKRPIWLQAWGGTNTIARALKTIVEEHPEKMDAVAKKMRFYFIWEQDETYQNYILPHWGRYSIPTIISDQFWAIAYQWKKVQPPELHKYFEAPWMKQNILESHGPLAALYKAHVEGSHGLAGDHGFEVGDFRSEGDSPAFLHTIDTGLRNLESPGWGGWGGRYVKVRENTWLDPVPVRGYAHPPGRWYTRSAWGRNSTREGTEATEAQRRAYFKPMWRWTQALQNDFAARADWSVLPFGAANHPPRVQLSHALDLEASPAARVELQAQATDPDGDGLRYRWWHYGEAGTYGGAVKLRSANRSRASLVVPKDAAQGETIHIVVEVTDSGTPALTRYQRVVVTVR